MHMSVRFWACRQGFHGHVKVMEIVDGSSQNLEVCVANVMAECPSWRPSWTLHSLERKRVWVGFAFEDSSTILIYTIWAWCIIVPKWRLNWLFTFWVYDKNWRSVILGLFVSVCLYLVILSSAIVKIASDARSGSRMTSSVTSKMPFCYCTKYMF